MDNEIVDYIEGGLLLRYKEENITLFTTKWMKPGENDLDKLKNHNLGRQIAPVFPIDGV